MTNPDFSKCECRHCAGPVEFPIEAGGQTITCPHCGQAMVLPGGEVVATKSSYTSSWLNVVIWGVIITASIVLFILKHHFQRPVAENVPDKASVAATNPVVKVPEGATTNGFVVSKLKLEKTPGSSLVYVMGTVSNLTDKQRFGVKAEFSLADSNGVSVGLASDYVASLDPRGVWKFKALVMGAKATHATLNSVREDQ
ncbi:MAG TPA: FxLYD domain-containing protein [Verrucomicrobiae bacterium]|nr:FxLYD domain-containing protein [Verrucomicrobiae bacterium]